mgnify:FL=1
MKKNNDPYKSQDSQSYFKGNKLYSFLKVAEVGSISKTAEQLNYTQSGLTYLLNTLETDIGLQLLKRDHKGVSLTPEGRELVPYFKSLIDLEKNIQNKIDELIQNDSEIIRIGAIPSIAKYCFPTLIKRFKEDNPNVNVIFRAGGGAEIPKLIQNHTLDIGIIDIVHANNMDCIPLADEPVLVAFPAEWNLNPVNGGIPVEALTDRPMLCFASNPLNSGFRIMKDQKLENKFLIDSDGDTAMSMISQGLGFSFLSERYAVDCPDEVYMYPVNPPFHRKLCIVSDSFSDLHPLAKKFVKLLQDEFF